MLSTGPGHRSETLPAVRAAKTTLHPSSHHELDKALDYAVEHWQEGDLLFVPHVQSLSFMFCKHRYPFEESDYRIQARFPRGKEVRQRLLREELEGLGAYGRVWIPLTYDTPSQVDGYRGFLEQHGRRLDTFHARGASMYLFEFNS